MTDRQPRLFGGSPGHRQLLTGGEAASVSHVGERPGVRPHASGRPVVHDSGHRDLHGEQPSLNSGKEQCDQRSGLLGHSGRVQLDGRDQEDYINGQPRRSISTDYGDSSKSRQYADH